MFLELRLAAGMGPGLCGSAHQPDSTGRRAGTWGAGPTALSRGHREGATGIEDPLLDLSCSDCGCGPADGAVKDGPKAGFANWRRTGRAWWGHTESLAVLRWVGAVQMLRQRHRWAGEQVGTRHRLAHSRSQGRRGAAAGPTELGSWLRVEVRAPCLPARSPLVASPPAPLPSPWASPRAGRGPAFQPRGANGRREGPGHSPGPGPWPGAAPRPTDGGGWGWGASDGSQSPGRTPALRRRSAMEPWALRIWKGRVPAAPRGWQGR